MSLRLCLTEETLLEHPVIAAVAEEVTEIVVAFTPAERYGWCLCSVRDFCMQVRLRAHDRRLCRRSLCQLAKRIIM
jgi:hypothetical protein